MKRLILMRHAKSDWGASSDSDHDRPLNTRGLAAAATMGRVLTEGGEIPDRILSSSAVRARTTAELAAEAGGWNSAVEIVDDLYGASPGDVLSVIQSNARSAQRLLVVGHEPTTSQTVGVLTGARVRVATATAVGLDLPADDWKRVAPDAASIAFVLYPRLFSAKR